MIIKYNPDEWETTILHHICPFHQEHPGEAYAGCTCSSTCTNSYKPSGTDATNESEEVLNLERLMFYIGQYGFNVFVKYDAFRKDNNFTVMVGGYPRTDTNDPVGCLREIYQKKKRKESNL